MNGSPIIVANGLSMYCCCSQATAVVSLTTSCVPPPRPSAPTPTKASALVSLATLDACSPDADASKTVVLQTPGKGRSAFPEDLFSGGVGGDAGQGMHARYGRGCG